MLNVAIASLMWVTIALGLSRVFRSLPKRYATLMVGMFACLLAPLVVMLGTVWALGQLPAVRSTRNVVSSLAVANRVATNEPDDAITPSQFDATAEIPQVDVIGNVSRMGTEPLSSVPSTDSANISGKLYEYLGPALLLIWLAGIVVLSAVYARKLWLCRRWASTCRPIDDSHIQLQCKQISQRLQIDAPIRLLESDVIPTPVVVGFVRPKVILPADIAFSLTADQLASVLTHELSHVARKDHWAAAVQTLTRILYWWNPLVHWVSRRASELREMICDDIATSRDIAPKEYAKTIIQMAERTAATRELVGSLGISLSPVSELERRLRRIITEKSRAVDLRISRRFAAGLSALSVALIAGLLFAQVPVEVQAEKLDKADQAKPVVADNISSIILADARVSDFKPYGRVFDTNGKPVANAKVFVSATTVGVEPLAITDAEGNFRIETQLKILPSSALKLWSQSADGALFGMYRPQPNQSGEDVSRDIKIEPTKTAKIQVVDASGKPIPGAKVGVELYPALGPYITDADGMAIVHVPQSESIKSIFAWKDGSGLDYRAFTMMPRRNVDPAASVKEFDFAGIERLTLDGAVSINIQTVGDDDRPLEGVFVSPSVFNKSGAPDSLNLTSLREYFMTSSDRDGRIRIDWFPKWSGPVGLKIEKKGYSAGRTSFDPASQTDQLTIAVHRLVPIRGTVTLPDGKPASDLRIVAMGTAYGPFNNKFGEAKTNGEGKYEILVEPNMIYTVFVHGSKWVESGQSGFAVLAKAEEAIHDIVLRPATRLHGQLVDVMSKKPIAGQTVQLERRGVDWVALAKGVLPGAPDDRMMNASYIQRLETKTDANGLYEFSIGDGDYRLGTPDHPWLEKFSIHGDAQRLVHLSAQSTKQASLQGHVVDDTTGHSLAGAKIIGGTREMVMNMDKEWTTTSDQDGRFEVEFVPRQNFVQAISADNKLGAMLNLSKSDSVIQLRLQPLAAAKGRLMDAKGEAPMPNQELIYNVSISSDGRNVTSNHFRGKTTADANGAFVIEGLIPDCDYTIRHESKFANGILETEVAFFRTGIGQAIDLGNITNKPHSPEGQQLIEYEFNRPGSPQDKFKEAASEANAVSLNLAVLIGSPKDSYVKALFDDWAGTRAYRDDYRFVLINTDNKWLPAAQAFAKQFNVELKDAREKFCVVVLNSNKEILETIDKSKVSDGDSFSVTKFRTLLDPYRIPRKDAKAELDVALEQAARENKRVLVQCAAIGTRDDQRLTKWIGDNRQWEQDYVWVHIEPRWTGAREMIQSWKLSDRRGSPWLVILDASGKSIATSEKTSGRDIGFLMDKDTQEHLFNMFKSTRVHMSDAEIDAFLSAAANAMLQ